MKHTDGSRQASFSSQEDDDTNNKTTRDELPHQPQDTTRGEDTSMHDDSLGGDENRSSFDHMNASASSSSGNVISRGLTDELRKSVAKLPKKGLFNLVNDSQGGKSFEETYERVAALGEGGFASVFKAQHKKNKSHYAVKEIFHEDYEMNTGANSLKDEIAAMKCLRESPYIVRLFDVFDTEISFNKVTYLVMEEMEGGDLLDRITEKRAYSEADARAVARSLLQAVRFMHNKNYAHRDIKPENILLLSRDDDTTIKLCDFGCAQKVTGPFCMQDMAGSPQYAAPEVYNRTVDQGYGQECDLWSVGCVLFVMMGGYAPFEAETVYDLAEMICDGDWRFDDKFWGEISQPPKDLITKLLTVNVEERFTAEQALDSEWLKRRRKGDRGGSLRDRYNRSNSLRQLTRTASGDSTDLGLMKLARTTSFESLDDLDISAGISNRVVAPMYLTVDKLKRMNSRSSDDGFAGYASEEELLPTRPVPPKRVPMFWASESTANLDYDEDAKMAPSPGGGEADQIRWERSKKIPARRPKRRTSLTCGKVMFWSRGDAGKKGGESTTTGSKQTTAQEDSKSP